MLAVDRSTEDVSFILNKESLRAAIKAAELYEQYKECKITLYATARYTEKEFFLGTVSSPDIPEDTSLVNLDLSKPVSFRLTVSDPELNIVGSCEKVSYRYAEEPEGRSPIVRTDFRELGERLWTLHLEEGEIPVIQFNNKVKKHFRSKIVNDQKLMSSIMPEVIKQSVVHIGFNRSLDESDPDCFLFVWGAFLEGLSYSLEDIPNVAEEPNKINDLRDVADEISKRFSTKHKYFTKLFKLLEDNESA